MTFIINEFKQYFRGFTVSYWPAEKVLDLAIGFTSGLVAALAIGAVWFR